MNFEEALVYELNTITALTGKVFPQQAKEETKPPFVVYISSEGEQVMSLAGPTDMTELTCEFHIIGETYEQVKSITKAVLERIKSFFRRPIGQGGPVIKSVSYLEPVEDMEESANYHKISFDIRVRF